jgi:hypothetical protein
MTTLRVLPLPVAAVLLVLSSAPAEATVLAGGTLRGPTGAPSAGAVRVYAWPTEVRPGARRVMPLVGSARADARGSFRIADADRGRLRRLADRDGRLDFMAIGQTPGYAARTFFSRVVTGGTRARAATTHTSRQLTLRATAPYAPAGARAAQGCVNYTVGRTETEAWAPVGEINNAYRDTVATFTYGRKADSEFSVGVKLGDGNWEAQGSTTVQTDRGAEQSRSRRGPYARRLFSKFLFRKERVITCAPFGPESDVVRAVRWDGGWGSVKQRGTIRVCRTGLFPYSGGDRFATSSEAAAIFHAGVHVFGASLDVQSGFSEYVSTEFKFGGSRNKRHWLCGPRGVPITDAARIFSGKART